MCCWSHLTHFPRFLRGTFPTFRVLLMSFPTFFQSQFILLAVNASSWRRGWDWKGFMELPQMLLPFLFRPIICPRVFINLKMFEPWSYFKRSVTKYGIFDITEIGVLFLSNVFNNCWHFGGLVVLPCLNIVMHWFGVIIVVEILS